MLQKHSTQFCPLLSVIVPNGQRPSNINLISHVFVPTQMASTQDCKTIRNQDPFSKSLRTPADLSTSDCFNQSAGPTGPATFVDTLKSSIDLDLSRQRTGYGINQRALFKNFHKHEC
jgi:hypothetical protein